MHFRFLAGLALIFYSLQAVAQEPEDGFGKNRVQYKTFNWQYYSTDNFDIYFYEGGKSVARETADYLEEEYERVTETLGYALYSKAKLFIFNSTSDLQQSNIGVNESGFAIEGQTNFIKPLVEIAFPGSKAAFKKELIFEVSNLLINDMMYGGSLTDMFQSAYLFNLPDWVVEGAAAYVAEGWSPDLDDYMRDFFENRKFRKLTRLEGEGVTYGGQSVWNYIAEKYGINSISNILNLTRINRNIENSIIYTLGVPFKQFIIDWRNYYTDIATDVSRNYIAPNEADHVGDDNNRNYIYNQVKISPNGNFLAYSSNYRGKYTVWIRDLATGKEEKALSGGYKVINQKVQEDIPLLGWKDNNTLGIVNVEKGVYQMLLFEIGSKTFQKLNLSKFAQVTDFAFKDNGRVAVLSANANGQSDLFLLSVNRNSIRRVTNDGYDDMHPRFIPNSNTIVFSSNRTTDTLSKEKVPLTKLTNNYNLFLYDLDTTKVAVQRVTNTLSMDIMPLPSEDGYIYYLSDQKGIFNLYRYNINDKLYTQVSNFKYSIQTYDINFEKGKLAQVMLRKGADHIFLSPSFNFNQSNFTPATKRQEIKQALFISERIREKRLKELAAQEEEEEKAQQMAQDSISQIEATDIIDTDNYIFDTEVVKEQEKEKKPTSILENFARLKAERRVEGPLAYEPRVGFDNLTFSWVIDPLIGFGIQAEVQVNDLLENHKFYGGALVTTNLRSGRYFGEYHYLKDRLDYHVGFSRKTVFRTIEDTRTEEFDIKYVKHRIEAGVSYPLDVRSRIGITPFYVGTRSFDQDPNLLILNPGSGPRPAPIDTKRDYFGAKLEYVFDNTLALDLNLYEGTRAKISLEHFENFGDSDKSFANFKIDLEHYIKIHRELILATRLFYARSFGNAPKDFLLGGMKNWLFNDTDNEDKEGNPLNDPLNEDNSDILFVEYVTNMRGFDYNKFSGNNALLFNAELRFPVVKYFINGPIASNFFRNLQLIGFYDIGSAWTGNAPFAEENSLNTEILAPEGNSFSAKINNFGSPWLSSYGAGVRTVLLSYYLKFDVAWPIEDYEVLSPQFYLTLGFDF